MGNERQLQLIDNYLPFILIPRFNEESAVLQL